MFLFDIGNQGDQVEKAYDKAMKPQQRLQQVTNNCAMQLSEINNPTSSLSFLQFNSKAIWNATLRSSLVQGIQYIYECYIAKLHISDHSKGVVLKHSLAKASQLQSQFLGT